MQQQLDRLRSLRREADVLSRSLVGDLKPYRVGNAFRTLPTSNRFRPNITTTSSCLMALAMADQLNEFYGRNGAARAANGLRRVARLKTRTSGLPPINAFTTTLLLRAGGMLVDRGLAANDVLGFRRSDSNLGGLFRDLKRELPGRLAIDPHEPSSTVASWFLDAVERLEQSLSRSQWKSLADWAAIVFWHQMSLVASNDDARMDPVDMGMAASLLVRIRRVADDRLLKDFVHKLPSPLELDEGVRALFRHQASSGIWPKYFPLFHYGTGGSNFCFSFELLENVLHAFGNRDLVEEDDILGGLEKAVLWCKMSRLEYSEDGSTTYRGWNSGGQIESLSKGLPESWATAVVHMFLKILRDVLSRSIERHILARYGSQKPPSQSTEQWDSLIDYDIVISGRRTTLKKTLKREMLDRIDPTGSKLPERKSALLFGPPGTSKTTLAKAFARSLGWPFIGIDPSDLLGNGLENIHQTTSSIFGDLLDVSRAVVLFDEMDALVRQRQERTDVIREFLTTSMLPLLAKLHDEGRVVYFMATNHLQRFDDAIKRPGRFDLLLCVGPPSWHRKLSGLDLLLGHEVTSNELNRVRNRLRRWAPPGSELGRKLDLFTFGEVQNLLDAWRAGEPVAAAVQRDGAEGSVGNAVSSWHERFIILKPSEASQEVPVTTRQEYDRDRDESRLQ